MKMFNQLFCSIKICITLNMQGPTKNHKCNKHKKCILNYDSVNLFFTFFKYIYLWEINYT